MPCETHNISVRTEGNAHVVDLTGDVANALEAGAIKNGIVTVFVGGSTAAITTTEFEPGLANHDLARLFEQLAPENARYQHEDTWHDDNGHSHVRATLIGPSVCVPLIAGKLTLGRWQQIVLLDFDTQRRDRQILVQVVGEK